MKKLKQISERISLEISEVEKLTIKPKGVSFSTNVYTNKKNETINTYRIEINIVPTGKYFKI